MADLTITAANVVPGAGARITNGTAGATVTAGQVVYLDPADNRPMVLKKCLEDVVEMYMKGELKPQVGGVYPVDQLAEAHTALEGGKTTGKLTVKW